MNKKEDFKHLSAYSFRTAHRFKIIPFPKLIERSHWSILMAMLYAIYKR